MPRILVVDDQQENLNIVTSTLENFIEGCEVVGHTDSQLALEAAIHPSSDFDLIITDVKMPEKDGFEFTEEYRTKRMTHSVPVLMISGVFTESEDRARGLTSGADSYLSKPYRLDELIAQVRVLLRIKRTEDELRAKEAALQVELQRRGGALVALENRFERLFDASPAPVWIIDAHSHEDGYIMLDANPVGCQLLGRTRQQMHKLHLRSVLSEAAYSTLEDAVPAWRAESETHFEIHVDHPQRGLLDVEICGRPIELGDTSALLLHLYDITERVRDERETRSRATLEAIGRLSGGIAHDFNNLLTSVLGFTHLLKEGVPQNSQAQEDADRILHAAETASGLTRKLMVFGQRQVLPQHPVDLNRAVRNGDQMLRRIIGEHIELVCLLGERIPFIESDEPLIEQLLTDLALNAREAMAQGGKIIIETRREMLADGQAASLHRDADPGEYAVLSVTDEGRGIPQAMLEAIFEPFFTTKYTETRTTGLGLSTAYGIVRRAGGFIVVDSKEGRGTRMEAWFPACSGEGIAASSPSRPGGKETILVVEDEEHVLRICVRLLSRLGYQVIEARNGMEAVTRSQNHDGPIHLILTDLVMPKLGGQEVVAQISKDRPKARAIFTSGYTGRSLKMEAGKDIPFLMKPFTGDTLARKVRDVLDA